MHVVAKGDYRYHRVGDWSCSNEAKPWLAYENSTVACEPWNVGRTYYDQSYSVVTTTITHPEATVTGALHNCTLQNGWCVTSPQLQITANEPLAGYQILLIEGRRNTEIFACPELQTSCQIPLLEGENNFEYWALSSWGDSSRKGTMNVKVDTVAPNLNLVVNGTLGQNNWYVSNTIITAEGADGTSGIYEKVLSIDNGTTWIPSATLTDGVYQVDIKITDNAFNVSTASTSIQVDTVTPTLSLSISGAKGSGNYYISKPKITATTFDAASGVALVQAKIDNGNWIDTNEITIEDGIHAYQFRAYDNAGNMTETPVQTIQVDTIPPTVEADSEINLGETLYYTLRDNGSGLSISRIVIEDEDEKYKKIVWVEKISGNKIEGDILWDGKFADKTVAGVGEYFITFKISDRAGNETFYTTIVNVNPLSYFQSIPEFILPLNQSPLPEEEGQSEGEHTQSFGGTTAPQNNESALQILEFSSSAAAGTNAATNPTSNILWGTAAAAVIGMMTAYALEQQKKREEAEAAQIAQVTAAVESKNAAIEAGRIAMIEQLKIRNWQAGKDTLAAWIELLQKQNVSQEEIDKLKQEAGTKGLGVAINNAKNLSLSLAARQFINQQAYDIYRQGEYQYVTPNNKKGKNNPFAGVSAG
ncbi:MAG: Ig-like domain repeat protein, partial [Anaerolineales bacterium]